MKDIEIIEKAIQKYEKETYGLDETEYEESKAFDHALMEAIVLARADAELQTLNALKIGMPLILFKCFGLTQKDKGFKTLYKEMENALKNFKEVEKNEL